jgi:quinol-cytochrome oxidoreductase complex cytochrome b subunit
VTSLVVVLTVLAIGLFAAAIRSGRWGVWVAGYLFAFLALATAVMEMT